MPKPLDLDRLEKFKSRTTSKNIPEPDVLRSEERAVRWPSREPMMDGQISIKAPLGTLDRFKRICKDDRRTYADMLRILMDRYEEEHRSSSM